MASQESLVAIIGGGLSGLALARQLAKHGIRSHLFDTGKRSLGGRCSSRRIPELDTAVDHACQMFGSQIHRFPGVEELVKEMSKANVVRRVAAQEIAVLDVVSGLLEKTSSEDAAVQFYVSSDAQLGWAAMAEYLARDKEHISVFQDVWISSLYNEGGSWWVKERSKWRKDVYSYVAIAHCGKCATKLIETSNVWTAAHEPLQCKFIPGYGVVKGSGKSSSKSCSHNKLDILSVFVAVVAVEAKPNAEKRGSSPKEADDSPSYPSYLAIDKDDVLSFASNNSRKYRASNGDATCKESNTNLTPGDVWTLVSTSSFASANKCPQENIPKEVEDRVSQQLIRRFLDLVPESGSRTLVLKHLQLWGAALPANVLPQEFIHDSEHRIGIVGDWLVHGSVEGALQSGIMLADFLKEHGVAGSAPDVKRYKKFFQVLPNATAVQTQASCATDEPAAEPDQQKGDGVSKGGKGSSRNEGYGNSHGGKGSSRNEGYADRSEGSSNSRWRSKRN